jgi:hypothetical protein
MTTLLFLLAALQPPAPAPQKVEIVSVTGCLKESTPNTWTLTAATDPVPSLANAPTPSDIPATPPAGKNTFRLIGVSEFNLPAHRDRLNMTSVVTVSPTCVGAAK